LLDDRRMIEGFGSGRKTCRSGGSGTLAETN
jgi:hypothetical protein